MSRIIALPSRKVQAARKTPRPAARFGEGLAVPFVPYFGRQPFTASDLAWWARESNADADGLTTVEENRLADRLASEAKALDALCSGYVG